MPSPHNSLLTANRFALQSLRYHWRVNASILLGIIVGTAVLTGALAVGDSVRHSLRNLTLERLGKIDRVLVADHFFSQTAVHRLGLETQPVDGLVAALPAVIMPQSTLENQLSTQNRRAGQVMLVGCEPSFWDLATTGPKPRRHPQGREIVLNATLATALGAKVGDPIILRLQKATRIAGDSPLANTTDRVQSIAELRVIEILASEGLGRFSLRANQALPRTAFVPLETLQNALDKPDQINAVLVARDDRVGQHDAGIPDSTSQLLEQRLRPTLSDIGLRLEDVSLNFLNEESNQHQSSFRYLNLSTDAMMLPDPSREVLDAALEPFAHQQVLTYLANSIEVAADASERPKSAIPYSTITAIAVEHVLSPVQRDGETQVVPLDTDQIILNRWAADDLDVKLGDKIRVRYFAPETTHGVAEERSELFTLSHVASLTEPLLPYENSKPARYVEPLERTNDPKLTPTVPGITDQDSIDEWDPPFPFDYGRIRDQDEDYWDRYRTTPKAFISLAAGQQIWGSRFGRATGFRIMRNDAESFTRVRQAIEEAASRQPVAFGFRWLHLRRDGLQASKGTTPFNLLFLGFSSFIIAAAVMLVSLLFRLSLEQRSDEVGLLLASGLNQQQISRLFLLQGMALAVLGATAGTLLGIGYAWLMIAGLRSWWLAAVVTPFLQLAIRPTTLIVGAVAGGIVCFATIYWTVRKFTRLTVRSLMARQLETRASSDGRRPVNLISLGLWGVAIGCAGLALFLTGEAQAGAFFGSGASVLAAMLLQTSTWLRHSTASGRTSSRFGLSQLIVKNIGRNPGRSVLTTGLTATACFLIVAISAFRLSPTESGTGGLALIGQSDIPIFENLDDSQIREDLMGVEAAAVQDARIFGLRLVDGDDASCRNLYQAQRPKIIGITQDFAAHFDDQNSISFDWAKTAAVTDQLRANPWKLLFDSPSSQIDIVPVILDKNTAMYSLHLYRGIGEEFELNYGHNKVRFRVVGLLANSVLQGSLLVSEEHLLKRFPDVSGYRYFAVKCPRDSEVRVQSVLEDNFSDRGMLLYKTDVLLRDLLAVQNTYLSTFQSLGGLGLLLGTFGIVAVQLRSVFERRRELALLRATGFSQNRLTKLVLMEHLSLLVGGLFIGVVAALVAVLPHAWSNNVRIPWSTLAAVLTTIVAIGIVSGRVALRPQARLPLVESLRDN